MQKQEEQKNTPAPMLITDPVEFAIVDYFRRQNDPPYIAQCIELILDYYLATLSYAPIADDLPVNCTDFDALYHLHQLQKVCEGKAII